MKRVVYLIILLLIIFWLAIFVAANLDEVPVNWFIDKPWGEAPLIVIILSSILLGAFLAALAGGISQAKLLSQKRRQGKTISRLEKEVATLKSIPVKEVEKEIKEAAESE